MKVSFSNKYVRILGLIIIIYVSWHFFHKSNNGQDNQSAVAVNAIKIKKQLWDDEFTAMGDVKASERVDVSFDNPGILANLNFESGQAVKKGDVIATLKADNEIAEVNKAEAQYTLDTQLYNEKHQLYKSRFGSKSELDTAYTLMQQDLATLNVAKANLAQKVIIAPFSGVMGIKKVDEGQYVHAGDIICNIESLDKMFVDFRIPEKFVTKIHPGLEVSFTSEALAHRAFTATIQASDMKIDNDNRSLLIRAVAKNSDHLLLSGMSAVVKIPNPENEVIAIPQTALNFEPNGSYVFVVDHNNIAHQRAVITGSRNENDIVVTDGLKVNEVIIIAGSLKVHDGMLVKIIDKASGGK